MQSRRFRAHQDYSWQMCLPDGSANIVGGVPEAVDELGIETLLYDTRESSVLGRRGKKLKLLLSGVASQLRCDFMRRRVRDTILYDVVEGEQNWPLHAILINALRNPNWSSDLVDSAITFNGKTRFSIKCGVLRSPPNIVDFGSEPPMLDPRISKASDDSRVQLAEELRDCRLPDREGLLVAVTRIQSAKNLSREGVWRGLIAEIE